MDEQLWVHGPVCGLCMPEGCADKFKQGPHAGRWTVTNNLFVYVQICAEEGRGRDRRNRDAWWDHSLIREGAEEGKESSPPGESRTIRPGLICIYRESPLSALPSPRLSGYLHTHTHTHTHTHVFVLFLTNQFLRAACLQGVLALLNAADFSPSVGSRSLHSSVSPFGPLSSHTFHS
mmetsp:Transcript_18115/g.36741  ORF Transcript_18115/g.36741 Transcript_18115/m.36741 type:complete len:177 (-) Transcript_18115:520-1050(-)